MPRLERELQEQIDMLKALVEMQTAVIRTMESRLADTRTMALNTASAVTEIQITYAPSLGVMRDER